jgi:crossover junction endodeoxyribonuclease RuvC
MGYGVLSIEGGVASLLSLGVLKLQKSDDLYERLRLIYARVISLIEEFNADEIAIESPFFGKNVQSMLKLGRAQGVAIVAALNRGLHVTEYAPLKIKMAITGNGGASKEQVAGMLQHILHIPNELMLPQLDATDGLAAAFCHYLQSGRPVSGKSYSGWKDFIVKHPDKIRR